jgi:CheY-like chemotaxis protein
VRILSVDSEPFFLAAVSLIWREKGHEIRTAENALDAIQILATYTPQVVTLNYCLFNMDVGHFIRLLRNSPRLTSTRIYVISGMGGSAAPQECLDAGADCCFYKPMQADDLQLVPEWGNDEDFRAGAGSFIAKRFTSGEGELSVTAEEIEQWRQEVGPILKARFDSEGGISGRRECDCLNETTDISILT